MRDLSVPTLCYEQSYVLTRIDLLDCHASYESAYYLEQVRNVSGLKHTNWAISPL